MIASLQKSRLVHIEASAHPDSGIWKIAIWIQYSVDSTENSPILIFFFFFFMVFSAFQGNECLHFSARTSTSVTMFTRDPARTN